MHTATAKDRAAQGKRRIHRQKAPRGRKPKSPDEVVNNDAKANVTDPESRIMKTRKGYVQGLNAQAVVTNDQIIVAGDVTQEENDKKQLHPMLEQAESNRQKVAIEACRSEWLLICATHNLLKLWRSGKYVSAPCRAGKICMN